MAKFLFVEDNDDARDMGMQTLRRNFPQDEFVEASDYLGATKALAEQGPFDGIISDYNYSGVNDRGRHNKEGSGGLDLLEHVQKSGAKIPFVFITGRTLKEVQADLAKRVLEPPDHIFHKPVAVAKIAEYLKKTFCQEKRGDPSQTGGSLEGSEPK